MPLEICAELNTKINGIACDNDSGAGLGKAYVIADYQKLTPFTRDTDGTITNIVNHLSPGTTFFEYRFRTAGLVENKTGNSYVQTLTIALDFAAYDQVTKNEINKLDKQYTYWMIEQNGRYQVIGDKGRGLIALDDGINKNGGQLPEDATSVTVILTGRNAGLADFATPEAALAAIMQAGTAGNAFGNY